MNAEEALQLCRLAKTISPAQAVDEYTPAAWALILEDVRFVDAREALKVLGGEQEWIHVSHIVKRVKMMRNKRISDFGVIPDPPGHIGADPAAYHRWIGETNKRIANGEITSREQITHPPELVNQARPVAALGQVGKGIPSDARAAYREGRRKASEETTAQRALREQRQAAKQAERETARAADRAARDEREPA